MLEALKTRIRTLEARLTPRTTEIKFRGFLLRFHQSIWWVNESQYLFDEEIVPYFSAIRRPENQLKCIVDAGAATGLFAVAAAQVYPAADFMLFEPSPRQRVLLKRNLRLNGIQALRARIFETALWDREGSMAFRTIGAMSSIEATSELAGKLSFDERVGTTTLDNWCARVRPERIDVVKMDIEGAEVEAILGARQTLKKFRPELLIMAYHMRDGIRTFERCANELVTCGYNVSEVPGTSGYLHGVYP